MSFCSIALQILGVPATHVNMHISEAKRKRRSCRECLSLLDSLRNRIICWAVLSFAFFFPFPPRCYCKGWVQILQGCERCILLGGTTESLARWLCMVPGALPFLCRMFAFIRDRCLASVTQEPPVAACKDPLLISSPPLDPCMPGCPHRAPDLGITWAACGFLGVLNVSRRYLRLVLGPRSARAELCRDAQW